MPRISEIERRLTDERRCELWDRLLGQRETVEEIVAWLHSIGVKASRSSLYRMRQRATALAKLNEFKQLIVDRALRADVEAYIDRLRPIVESAPKC